MKPIAIRHDMTASKLRTIEQTLLSRKATIRAADFIQFIPQLLQDWTEDDVRNLDVSELYALRIPMRRAIEKFKRRH